MQRDVAWEDQAGAASAGRGEGLLRSRHYQQEKLLSGRNLILMIQDTNTKCQ